MPDDASAPVITAAHVEKETLVVDVNIPAHDARVTTPLFSHTRELALQACGGRCYVCGRTAEESGHPIELHHYPVERSLGDLVDWALFRAQAQAGDYGPGPQAFDWSSFDPVKWFTFVDDMRHNGLALCKQHHTVADTGIHTLPHPLWLAQRFAKEGYQFDKVEIIHHEQV